MATVRVPQDDQSRYGGSHVSRLPTFRFGGCRYVGAAGLECPLGDEALVVLPDFFDLQALRLDRVQIGAPRDRPRRVAGARFGGEAGLSPIDAWGATAAALAVGSMEHTMKALCPLFPMHPARRLSSDAPHARPPHGHGRRRAPPAQRFTATSEMLSTFWPTELLV